MKRLQRFIISCVPVGAAVVFILNAHTAFAAQDKCQKAVEKIGQKLQSEAMSSLTSCADAMTQAAVRGNLASAAATCESKFAAVFDRAKVSQGKSSIARFQASIDKLVPGTCSTEDLFTLGHLGSGSAGTAPPPPSASPSAQEWAKNWLAVANLKVAVLREVSQVRNFMNRLGDMISATGDCRGSETRPNLCQFNLQCRTHACQLTNASSASLTLAAAAGATIPLSISGQVLLDFCTMKDAGFGLGDQGELVMVLGSPARSITVPSIAGITICIEQIAAEGWCDCSGLGVTLNTAICQDHVLSNGNTCKGPSTGVTTPPESPCFCDDGSHIPGDECSTSKACPDGSVCGIKLSGGACHPGTANGSLQGVFAGASTTGDCVLLDTLQFTTPTAATVGPDGQPCTSDDTAVPIARVPIPLTTGTAQATVVDAVGAAGSCDGGKTKCVENANCADKVCNGVNLTTVLAGPIVGGKLNSCQAAEAGILTGLNLVGGISAIDVAGLGDLAAVFKLTCE